MDIWLILTVVLVLPGALLSIINVIYIIIEAKKQVRNSTSEYRENTFR